MKRIRLLILSLMTLMLLLCLASCGGSGVDELNVHTHNYKETVVPATCQEKGYTIKVCESCGDEMQYNFTPELNEHTPSEWTETKEATCLEAGEKKKICTSCGEILEVSIIPIADHVDGQWVTTKEATCKVLGEEQLSCTLCKKVIKTQNIPLKEHTAGAWVSVKNANCTETGAEKIYCTMCNDELETKTIPVNSTHVYNTVVTPPSENNSGNITHTCGLCGVTVVDEYIDQNHLTANEIYNMIWGATVRIETYDKNQELFGVGSGFLINNNGMIVTNYHVIQGAYSVKVRFYDGSTYAVDSILGYDATEDVALFKIEKSNTPYLKISNERPKTGDTVYALGNPLGVNNIFSSGIISNSNIIVSGKQCVAITTPISPGNSGGPLVNTKGEVVGLVDMTIMEAQNLNFAILSDKIAKVSTASPISIVNLYNKTLKENALLILKSYLIASATITDEFKNYTCFYKLEETEETIGVEYYYQYNSKADHLNLKIDLVNNGERQYYFEFVMKELGDKYTVIMYDYSKGQVMVEATANVTVPVTTYEESFESIFELNEFRYNPFDEEECDKSKQIFFGFYQLAIYYFDEFLEKSNTGLTASDFNFVV